jgi:ABC-type multidrug transport system ATPase subunit
VTGTLLFNGKPRDAAFAHVSGYVEQWDSHHPWSTVREALEFSGRLRLNDAVSDEELAKRVDNTLSILGIEHLQHELVGGEGIPGVSQEVRKKLTIAVELVTQPKLLFLDEPSQWRTQHSYGCDHEPVQDEC